MKIRKVSGIVVAAVCLLGGGQNAFADASGGAKEKAGGHTPAAEQDKRTDITDGQKGVPDEYATTPVRQGALKEASDNKWMNHEVTNQEGEKLGKITKVLKDEKTQDIEYAFIEMPDAQHSMPIRWSRFQEQGDKLLLNTKKDELLPEISRADTKDRSPDLAMFMEEIEQKRSEQKPQVGPGDGRGTSRPEASAGESGEEKAAGNLGTRGAPPGGAPQMKGEGQKKNH